ncbi:MAG: hypothetical protein SWH61_07270 [Thermodesulfobacteriota bacterium]|nr:hypothetical protein [Thermodesulfobacteriota bacterium]
MKKFTVLAMAACLAFALAVPAMAVDVDFSGYYRVRGFYNSNITLNDQTPESEAYYDNRFRLQTVFKATDTLSVTTRFDVFDDDNFGAQQEGNIDWDRVYMTALTDVGMFIIGHQQAGVWGLDVFDDDYNDDRIKYVGKSGPVTFGAIIQKTQEQDSTTAFTADGEADADTDVYYAFGIFKQDNIEAGLLGAYARNNDPSYTTTVGGIVYTLPGYTMTKQALLPYWKLAFGPIGFQGEIVWESGEYDWDSLVVQDTDISALSYNVEGSFDLDMAHLYLGWASVSGQEQAEVVKMISGQGGELTIGNASYGGLGDDFNPLALFTDDMGGKILNSGVGQIRGVELLYAGADVTVNDDLTVSGIIGQANADEAYTGDIDDDYGMEIDVSATYKIMDNLEYSCTLAYLMTGDLLGYDLGAKTATVDNTDDNFGFMHQIKASF